MSTKYKLQVSSPPRVPVVGSHHTLLMILGTTDILFPPKN